MYSNWSSGFYRQTFSGLVALSLISAGCSPPPRPNFDAVKDPQREPELTQQAEAAQQANDQGDAISLTQLNLPWESWHAYFIRGKKVGFIHASNQLELGNVDNQVLTKIDESLILRRGDTQFVQTLHQQALERRDGSLVSFTADTKMGPALSRYRGDVRGAQLVIAGTRQADNRSLLWKPYYRGLTAIQQSLLAKPLQLNQKRRFRQLMPAYYQVALVEMNCQNRASITTLDDKVYDALEIELTLSVEGQTVMASTLWTDDKGHLLKSFTPSVDLTAIACTKQQAEEPFQAEVDALSILTLPVEGAIEAPQFANTTTFVLRPKKALSNGADNQLVTSQPSQWVQAKDDGSVQVIVSRDASFQPPADYLTYQSSPQTADLQASSLINSQDAAVQRLAKLSGSDTATKIALELTQSVHQLIKPGDFSRGFANAAQTARDGVGDCTERALLLAAMLRAREIPSRVVAGLVYLPGSNRSVMAYHMWTAAYLDDHWVSLDATLGDIAPPDRIAIATSTLADGNEAQLFDPLLSFAGQYRVEIANVDSASEEKPSDAATESKKDATN